MTSLRPPNGNTYTTSPLSQCEGNLHANIVDAGVHVWRSSDWSKALPLLQAKRKQAVGSFVFYTQRIQDKNISISFERRFKKEALR